MLGEHHLLQGTLDNLIHQVMTLDGASKKTALTTSRLALLSVAIVISWMRLIMIIAMTL